MCACFTCETQPSTHSIDSSSSSISSGLFHDRKMIPWNRRGLKGLCILSAFLTFVIGLGLGLFVSLYFLPPRLESSIPGISEKYPGGVKFSELRSRSRENFDQRRFSNPISRRPIPRVEFVEPANRIMALHPWEEDRTTRISRNFKIQSEQSSLSKNRSEGSTQSSYSDSSMQNAISEELEQKLRSDQKLTDGIYWSSYVESLLPPGFTDAQMKQWRNFISVSPVMSMSEGCGRMQNRLLTLANQSRACCRYRQNSDQIQGEIFSFYLSRILGLRNLPPSALSLISTTSSQWAPVRDEVSQASWAESKPVVLTQFIPNLSPANIPVQFRHSNRRLHSSDIDITSNVNNSVTILAQWSDLIIFDYLTGNLDRVVNNLYNEQWNPMMMDSPAHNLALSPDGLLIFLDNESGLLHGYRLLDKYEVYHRLLLDSLCVFRRSTVNAIRKLNMEKSVGLLLKRQFRSSESKFTDVLPLLPEKSVKILNHRINTVFNQIQKCESLYSFSASTTS